MNGRLRESIANGAVQVDYFERCHFSGHAHLMRYVSVVCQAPLKADTLCARLLAYLTVCMSEPRGGSDCVKNLLFVGVIKFCGDQHLLHRG